MSSLSKFNKNTLRAVHRDEFLTPFDRIFDEFFAANVPSFTQDFGVDFFEKGSYPTKTQGQSTGGLGKIIPADA